MSPENADALRPEPPSNGSKGRDDGTRSESYSSTHDRSTAADKRASSAEPIAERDDVIRTLRYFLESGSVCELRALGVRQDPRAAPHVASGYFDDEHIEQIAGMAVELAPFSTGVYVTLNPVLPAVRARADSRVQHRPELTTRDADIDRRCWLLVDLDPSRPSGISSTDAEHQSALARAREVAAALSAESWPEPILADSGNGAHLLYSVALLNNDGGLLKSVLAALSFRFSDNAIKIDESTYKAAQLMRLYGTLNRKGDHTTDRPHRLAHIVSFPERREVVSRESLEHVAAWLSVSRSTSSRPSAGPATNALDAESWIAGHAPDARGPIPWGSGGQKWILAVCPWNPDHRNGSTFVLQFSDGGIHAGCLHDSCRGRGWLEFRDAVEPGWRSAQNGQSTEPRPASDDRAQDWDHPLPLDAPPVPPFPIEVFPEPLREWALAEAEATQTPIELPAMTALALLAGSVQGKREFRYEGRREQLSLYLAAAADPGSRKSAVFADATRPILEHERRLREAMRPTVRERRLKRNSLERRIRVLQDQEAHERDAAKRAVLGSEAAEVARQLDALPEVAEPRLLADDITMEKLGAEMALQGGRLIVASAEGGFFDLLAGRYVDRGSPNIALVLKAHVGDEFRDDRIGRASTWMEHPALSIALTVQPDVLLKAGKVPEFTGRGLLARFCMLLPLSVMGRRRAVVTPMPPAIASAYAEMFERILELPAALDSNGKIMTVPISAEAETVAAIHQYEAETEPLLGDTGRLRPIQGWAAKRVGLAIRIATIFALIRAHVGPVADHREVLIADDFARARKLGGCQDSCRLAQHHATPKVA